MLVAGLTTRLEEEIRAAVQQTHLRRRSSQTEDEAVPATARSPEAHSGPMGDLEQYVGVPKALLPGPDGVPLINNWWNLIQTSRTLFSDVRQFALQGVFGREEKDRRTGSSVTADLLLKRRLQLNRGGLLSSYFFPTTHLLRP